TYFKLALEWSSQDNNIVYRWTDYANDSTFTNIQQTSAARDDLSTNVEWLRGFVSQHVPNLFKSEEALFQAEVQRNNIINQAKRKAKELREDLYFDDPHNKGIIKEGLPIIANGWSGSKEIVQALGVKLNESQKNIQKTKNELKTVKKRLRRSLDTIHKLKTRLKTDSDSSCTNSDFEYQTIEKLTEKARLGSTILVSTNIFLDLVLNQPCITCHNTDSANRTAKIRVDGLQICVIITCSLCLDEVEYYNEREGDDFSKSIAGAGLIGGVNREELRSMLAVLGITRQNGHQQYFNKQSEFFYNLYQIADNSTENALITICEQLHKNNRDILEVSFDCAWSHVREASQASGEFIYNGKLE
ncbi:1144_t:CDS:2, partial [Ambispora gerdemannii]